MRNKIVVMLAAAALAGWAGGAAPRVMGDGAAGASGAAGQVGEEQIKGLIEKLSSEDFKTRNAAHKELVAAGPAALPALEKAAHSSDAEVAEQAKGAIQEIHQTLSAAASAALEKQQLWVYGMEKGAAWTNTSVWPVVYGETAYVAGMDGNLHAVDIQTGKGRWMTALAANGAQGTAASQVSAGEKVVSVTQGMMLTVYETKEGKQVWQKEFKAENGNGGGAVKPLVPAAGGAASPGAGGGVVLKPGFAVGPGGGVQMVRPEAWVVGDLVVERAGDEISAYKALTGEDAWKMDEKRGALLLCNTVIADGVAYLNTDQSVAAVDIAGHKELWRKEMAGCAKLFKSGQTLVCVAGPKIVALNSKTGEQIWEAEVLAEGDGGGAKSPAGGALNVAGAGAANRPAAGAINGRFNGIVMARKTAVDNQRVYVVVGETLTTYDLKDGAKFTAALDLSEDSKEGGAAANDPTISSGPVSSIASSGGISMRKPMINQVVAAGGIVYGVAMNGIYAFDGKNGGRLWLLPLKYNLPTEPVATEGVIYFATTGQRRFGFQPGGLQPAKGAPDATDTPINQPGLHALRVIK